MLLNNFEQVKEFHRKFELPIGDTPQQLHDPMVPGQATFIQSYMRYVERTIKQYREMTYQDDVRWGRIQMMLEELREFSEAKTLEDQADSLVDLVYFALGTAVMMGLPWEKLFDEVHRANMEKERVASSAESKRLNKLDVKKPEGWQAPDIAGILEDARSLARSLPCD